MALATHFLTLNVPLGQANGNWVEAIEATLEHHGKPLRWAITQVDSAAQMATVEAVVTTEL